MKTNQREAGSWDDLIFEDRNHAYGAYAVRKAYPSSVNRATLITLGFAAAILALSVFTNEGPLLPDPARPPREPGRLEREVTVIPEPPSKLSQRQQRTGKSAPVVTTDSIKEVITTPDAEPAQAGSEIGAVTEPSDGILTGLEEGLTVEVSVPIEEEKIWDRTEVAAQYKGGMEGLIKFISRNTRYPAVPRRMGVQGTVFVSFVVGKKGEVLDAAVIKGIDAACDAEALRVINLMKGWSPGMQGGVPVKVRMVLPITFKLADSIGGR